MSIPKVRFVETSAQASAEVRAYFADFEKRRQAWLSGASRDLVDRYERGEIELFIDDGGSLTFREGTR